MPLQRQLLLTALLLGAAAPAAAQPGPVWVSSQWHLWRVEVDGTGLKPLDETAGIRCGSPRWSPDGSQIAYDISEVGKEGIELVAINADGTNRRLLGKGGMPSWSEDGKMIVYQSAGKWVMTADGKGREPLPGFGYSLRFFPQEDRLASIAGAGFAVFNLVDAEEHLVGVGPYLVQHGYDITTDGRRICYGSKTAGLCLATFDDQFRQVKIDRLVPEGYGYHASWSPDNKRIVFAWQKSATDMTQIYFYDTETKAPPVLVPGIDLTRHNVNPNWSSDGRSIVFSRSAPLP